MRRAVVVTGGAGFIGSNIVSRLCAEDRWDVIVCDRLESADLGKWRNIAKSPIADFWQPEELFAQLDRHVDRVTAIVHMGAISSTTEQDADLILRTNFSLSRDLWDWCALNDTRFIYASSAATYGDGSAGFEDADDLASISRLQPLNAYGYSKKLFDQYAVREASRDHAPKQWAGLKFFNVYGPNEGHKGGMKSVIAQIWPKVAANEAVSLFRSHHPNYADGGQLRDFVFVDDVVDIVDWLLCEPEVSGVFNAGSGQARSFLDLANATFAAAGKEPRVAYIDMPEAIRDRYQYFTQASMDRIRTLGFSGQSTSLEEGVRRYVQTYLSQPDPFGETPVILPRLTLRQWIGWIGFALVFLLTAAVAVWRGDILRAGLDPQIPFQTYDPPPAPNYEEPGAWALRDVRTPGSGPAAVFFLHSTTYEGGKEWNGPIGDPDADAYLRRVVLPNYAWPFARAGSVSAPRYRQASLYTRLTLRDDARDARAFAYGDALMAFNAWLAAHPTGPLVLAGVEQGGELIDRLVRERIAPDPALSTRVAAVYLMDAIVARDPLSRSLPPCTTATSIRCIVAWSGVDQKNDGAAQRRLRRALVWDENGRLVDLAGRPALCVNPVSGADDEADVPARRHHGAANATGLEWGVRPAFIDRAVATRCRDGILRHTELTTESFREVGDWADRRKARQYNLFYADIEADVERRLNVWVASSPG